MDFDPPDCNLSRYPGVHLQVRALITIVAFQNEFLQFVIGQGGEPGPREDDPDGYSQSHSQYVTIEARKPAFFRGHAAT